MTDRYERIREALKNEENQFHWPPPPRCIRCGSTSTVDTGCGGYQSPDPSRGDTGAEGDEYYCNDCGARFIW